MGIHIIANQLFREANIAADWFSKFGHSITNSFSSDLWFGSIMADDAVGPTLARRDA